MSKRDRKNGVPTTATSIPLVDPHAMPPNPSIGDLVKDASAQVSTLVRAEVELAKAEITRDVKKGLTGSVFFILALVVLLYSTFFMFFFLAELLDTWLWRWAAFLIVFILMLVVTAVFGLLGYLKVRRIRGPQQTIESVKETTAALTPGLSKFAGGTSHTTATTTQAAAAPSAPARPRPEAPASRRPAVTAAPAVPVAVTTAAAGYPQNPQEPEYTESAEYVEYRQYDETLYAEQGEYTEYAQPAEYADYTEQGEYAEPTEPTWYPPGHDPTAAVYSDTGLPVTPPSDRLPGDPSGW